MTFAMLLGSMNYNNNLSFVLTFMLAGLGFVAMHQCQRNLVGLEMSFAGVEPVFAGHPAAVSLCRQQSLPQARVYRIGLYLRQSRKRKHDLAAGENQVCLLPLKTLQRGYLALPRFGARSLFPFELFRAWAWLHMDSKALVYPQPASDAPRPPPPR